MAKQGGVSSLRCESINICSPLWSKEIYEPSTGSLPLLPKESSSTNEGKCWNSKHLKKSSSLIEWNAEGVSATKTICSENRPFSESVSNLLCCVDENNSSQCGELHHPKEDNAVMKQCTGFLHGSARVVEIDDSKLYIISTSNKGRKYRRGANKRNNFIKIKLYFNSQNEQKSKRVSVTPENYSLEIDLNGNKNNIPKETKNRATQVNFQGKMCRDELIIDNKNQVLNYKKFKLINSYALGQNKSRMKYQETTIRTNPLYSSLAYHNTDSANKEDFDLLSLTNRNGNRTSDLGTSQKYVPYEALSNGEKVGTPQNDYCYKEEYYAQTADDNKDKIEQRDLNEDQDMIKLGMWLEMLNNSEYNTYNQYFGQFYSSGKTRNTKTRESEKEREFQTFIDELRQVDSASSWTPNQNARPEWNYFKQITSNNNVTPKHTFYTNHEIKFQEKQSDKINLQKKLSRIGSSSMESIELNEVSDDYYNFDIDEIPAEGQAYGGKHQWLGNFASVTSRNGLANNSSSNESSFRKMLQSIVTRVVPSVNDSVKKPEDKLKQNVYTFYKLSGKNSKSLWSKINPFKFSFLGNKTVSTERNKSAKNTFSSRSNNVQYSCLPTDNYPDSDNCRSQNDSIKSFCTGNIYFGEVYPSPLQNYNGTKQSANNYPYDTIPFMQCPGGCSLCIP